MLGILCENADTYLAIVLTDGTYENIFVMQDTELAVKKLSEFKDYINIAYCITIDKNGTMSYLTEEEVQDDYALTFNSIKEYVTSHKEFKKEELSKLEKIYIFDNLYTDFG